MHRFGAQRWRYRVVLLSTVGTLRLLFISPAVLAGGGPQNVALIVNPNDPMSLEVANCYVELRKIPPSNVIYIPWALDARSAGGAGFRERILKPAIAKLQERGVATQIDFFTYSSGFPYLIDFTPVFKDQTFPRQARPTTSLTSATYLFQFVLAERAEMFSPTANLYFAPKIAGRSLSRAFDASQAWGPGGAPVKTGLKYMACTALGVTHGHGNKPGEILASLRRAKQADGSKPKGTIYYMKNGDIRSQVRDGQYAEAVEQLALLGVDAVVLPGTAPQNKPDVMGITTGTAHLNLAGSGSRLLPGALVDNLTSAGGQMLIRPEKNPQTRISEFIRYGATGASGAVVEPFAIAAKFPTPDLHVHYARGCSLAEAFYQSVAGPCHLLVIGDPLCQPWAVPPMVEVEGVSLSSPVAGTVMIRAKATYPDSRTAARFQLFVNGVKTGQAGKDGVITWNTSACGDGWHNVRVVAIDDTPIAVQGAWDGVLQVKNGTDSLQISVPAAGRFALGSSIPVTVTSTRREKTLLLHNMQEVGALPDGSGLVNVDSAQLGKGKVDLYAAQEGEPRLRSRSVEVEIY